MGIFIALFIFSFLIFFHEWGHFLAARFFGVQVDVFSIGFGKRFLTKQIGKTEWSLSIIPLGGYVRMKGQDDSNPHLKSYDEDSYNSKKPWQRIIISLAGPFANFLLAFILYFIAANIGVPSPLSHIGHIQKASPAQKSGLQLGDKIININGHKIELWQDIGLNIHQREEPHHLTILRENNYIDLDITPKLLQTKNIFGEDENRYILGISADYTQTKIVFYSFSQAIDFASNQTQKASFYIIKSLKKLISGLIPMENLGGVVGIVDTTSKVSHMGITALLMFAALISVNLGVINLLPIPALDGGHVMFNIYEWITKREPNEEIMFKLTLMGWGILLALMLLGLYNDLNRIFG